jgi:superfamily II DNA or RNA helicase
LNLSQLKTSLQNKNKNLTKEKTENGPVSCSQASEELFQELTSTIIVNNSFCKIENFNDSNIQLIKKTLTYENAEALYELKQIKIQLALAYRYKNYKKLAWLKHRIGELEANTEICWLKDNQFPTGHLELVKEALGSAGVKYEVSDARRSLALPVHYRWSTNPKPPRYYQTDVVGLGKARHRGVFELAVGTGKTLMAQMLIYEIKVPTLVVVPSKDLCTQTADEYIKAFGKAAVELVDSSKKAQTKKPIRICTVHTLAALRRKDALEPLLADLGMIITDEVHHAAAATYSSLLPYFDHIYYRFGFSGTFMRNDSRTLDMWGFLSTVLYRYSAAQATKEGYLTPFEILVHEIEGRRGSNYHNEYKRNYCQNDDLLEAIHQILESDIAQDAQVLILVGQKEASGKVIHEFLNDLSIHNEYVDGDSDRDYVKRALSNFNAKKTKILIGSSVIGEGIDIRSTDHLIMAQGGKSEIAVTQAVGRLVRLFDGKIKGYLHDFRFNNTRYLIKHLEQRLEIYKKNFNGKLQDA